MKLVLDTCVILWSILEPERLSKTAVEALTSASAILYISAISAAEIACGVARSRIVLDRHWKPWLRRFIQANGWQVADIDLRTMEEAYSLPEFPHGDPADRIIIATARALQCPVVTADKRIRDYPHAETIW